MFTQCFHNAWRRCNSYLLTEQSHSRADADSKTKPVGNKHRVSNRDVITVIQGIYSYNVIAIYSYQGRSAMR